LIALLALSNQGETKVKVRIKEKDEETGFTEEVYKEKILDDKLLNHVYNALQASLLDEGSETAHEKLRGLEFNLDNIPELLTSLKAIYQSEISPVDIQLLQAMELEAAAIKRVVDGEEVVVLVGNTGTGKTTTLHYLSGAHFEASRSGMSLKNSVLNANSFKIGEGQTSETSYVSMLESSRVPMLKELCKDANGAERNVYFCDTPGFCDTAGIEVSILNSQQIIGALQGASSVRVMMVVRSSIFDVDRGERLLDALAPIAKLFADLDKSKSAVQYVFTGDTVSQYSIIDTINDLVKSIDNGTRKGVDTGVVTLLKDMQSKFAGQATNVKQITLPDSRKVNSPDVKRTRASIVASTLSSKPIQSPLNEIHAYIEPKAEAALDKHFTLLSTAVNKVAAKLLDPANKNVREIMNLLFDKFGKLVFLAKFLPSSNAKLKLEGCLQSLASIRGNLSLSIEANKEVYSEEQVVRFQKLTEIIPAIDNLIKTCSTEIKQKENIEAAAKRAEDQAGKGESLAEGASLEKALSAIEEIDPWDAINDYIAGLRESLAQFSRFEALTCDHCMADAIIKLIELDQVKDNEDDEEEEAKSVLPRVARAPEDALIAESIQAGFTAFGVTNLAGLKEVRDALKKGRTDIYESTFNGLAPLDFIVAAIQNLRSFNEVFGGLYLNNEETQLNVDALVTDMLEKVILTLKAKFQCAKSVQDYRVMGLILNRLDQIREIPVISAALKNQEPVIFEEEVMPVEEEIVDAPPVPAVVEAPESDEEPSFAEYEELGKEPSEEPEPTEVVLEAPFAEEVVEFLNEMVEVVSELAEGAENASLAPEEEAAEDSPVQEVEVSEIAQRPPLNRHSGAQVSREEEPVIIANREEQYAQQLKSFKTDFIFEIHELIFAISPLLSKDHSLDELDAKDLLYVLNVFEAFKALPKSAKEHFSDFRIELEREVVLDEKEKENEKDKDKDKDKDKVEVKAEAETETEEVEVEVETLNISDLHQRLRDYIGVKLAAVVSELEEICQADSYSSISAVGQCLEQLWFIASLPHAGEAFLAEPHKNAVKFVTKLSTNYTTALKAETPVSDSTYLAIKEYIDLVNETSWLDVLSLRAETEKELATALESRVAGLLVKLTEMDLGIEHPENIVACMWIHEELESICKHFSSELTEKTNQNIQELKELFAAIDESLDRIGAMCEDYSSDAEKNFPIEADQFLLAASYIYNCEMRTLCLDKVNEIKPKFEAALNAFSRKALLLVEPGLSSISEAAKRVGKEAADIEAMNAKVQGSEETKGMSHCFADLVMLSEKLPESEEYKKVVDNRLTGMKESLTGLLKALEANLEEYSMAYAQVAERSGAAEEVKKEMDPTGGDSDEDATSTASSGSIEKDRFARTLKICEALMSLDPYIPLTSSGEAAVSSPVNLFAKFSPILSQEAAEELNEILGFLGDANYAGLIAKVNSSSLTPALMDNLRGRVAAVVSSMAQELAAETRSLDSTSKEVPPRLNEFLSVLEKLTKVNKLKVAGLLTSGINELCVAATVSAEKAIASWIKRYSKHISGLINDLKFKEGMEALAGFETTINAFGVRASLGEMYLAGCKRELTGRLGFLQEYFRGDIYKWYQGVEKITLAEVNHALMELEGREWDGYAFSDLWTSISLDVLEGVVGNPTKHRKGKCLLIEEEREELSIEALIRSFDAIGGKISGVENDPTENIMKVKEKCRATLLSFQDKALSDTPPKKKEKPKLKTYDPYAWNAFDATSSRFGFGYNAPIVKRTFSDKLNDIERFVRNQALFSQYFGEIHFPILENYVSTELQKLSGAIHKELEAFRIPAKEILSLQTIYLKLGSLELVQNTYSRCQEAVSNLAAVSMDRLTEKLSGYFLASQAEALEEAEASSSDKKGGFFGKFFSGKGKAGDASKEQNTWFKEVYSDFERLSSLNTLRVELSKKGVGRGSSESEEKGMLPSSFDDQMFNVFKSCDQIFGSNPPAFDKALAEFDTDALEQAFVKVKAWGEMATRLTNYTNPEYRLHKYQDKLTSGFNQDHMAERVRAEAGAIKTRIQTRRGNLATLGAPGQVETQDKKHQAYQKLLKEVIFLAGLPKIETHLNIKAGVSEKFKSECVAIMKEYLQGVYTSANAELNEDLIQKEDWDKFNAYYQELIAFGVCSSQADLGSIQLMPAQTGKKKAKKGDTFLATLAASMLKTEFTAKLDAEILKINGFISNPTIDESFKLATIIRSLVGLQNMSTTLTVFSGAIKHQIALLIAILQEKLDVDGFESLLTGLQEEESGKGQTLIDEQPALKGYAIRIRNVSTEAFGIDYVLNGMESVSAESEEPAALSSEVKEKLQTTFEGFDEKYKGLLDKYLPLNFSSDPAQMDNLVAEMKAFLEVDPIEVFEDGSVNWDQRATGKVAELMAYLFAIWTLGDSECYYQMPGEDSPEKRKSLKLPHAAQVMSIFTMLNVLGGEEEGLKSHLAQVLTGEGKSIVIAVTASILALAGYDVDCACYSEFLSTRDFNDFKDVFELIGVKDYISYGTFNDLFESVLSSEGDLRDLVEKVILSPEARVEAFESPAEEESDEEEEFEDAASNSGSEAGTPPPPVLEETVMSEVEAEVSKPKRPRVIVADEVDVFLDKSFFGSLYQPFFLLGDEYTKALIESIWLSHKNNRKADLKIEAIKGSDEYQACIEHYSDTWAFLFEAAVIEMLQGLNTYDGKKPMANGEMHTYSVNPATQKIEYAYQDGTSSTIRKGFNTVWAALAERDRGRITDKDVLAKYIGVRVNCGAFSYAKLLEEMGDFAAVLGVSGTLRELSEPEQAVVKDRFAIHDQVHIPSAYGQNKLDYNPEAADTIQVEGNLGYAYTLAGEIRNKLVGRGEGSTERPVIVFFESKAELKDFLSSKAMDALKPRVADMSEALGGTPEEVAKLMKRATEAGKITFALSEDGRGRDFKSINRKVNVGGGLAVISAFLPSQVSLERQFAGRTARQGKKGSFSMVLNEDRLIQDYGKFGVTAEGIKEAKGRSELYQYLCKARTAKFKAQYATLTANIEAAIKALHPASLELLKLVRQYESGGDTSEIAALLKQFNEPATGSGLGLTGSGKEAKVLFALDATGSMGSLINGAKSVLEQSLKALESVLEDAGIDPAAVKGCISIYRSYNFASDPKDIYDESGYFAFDDAGRGRLLRFIRTVEADHGSYDGGKEAVEIPLMHAGRDGATSVVVLGDAPPEPSLARVKHLRTRAGDDHRSRSFDQVHSSHDDLYSEATWYRKEANNLKEKGVPVHTFYLKSWAKEEFEEIAGITGGKSEYLDVSSSQASNSISALFGQTILKDVAGGDAEMYENLMGKYSELTLSSGRK